MSHFSWYNIIKLYIMKWINKLTLYMLQPEPLTLRVLNFIQVVELKTFSTTHIGKLSGRYTFVFFLWSFFNYVCTLSGNFTPLKKKVCASFERNIPAWLICTSWVTWNYTSIYVTPVPAPHPSLLEANAAGLCSYRLPPARVQVHDVDECACTEIVNLM
jgi:hypothetical protein